MNKSKYQFLEQNGESIHGKNIGLVTLKMFQKFIFSFTN